MSRKKSSSAKRNHAKDKNKSSENKIQHDTPNNLADNLNNNSDRKTDTDTVENKTQVFDAVKQNNDEDNPEKKENKVEIEPAVIKEAFPLEAVDVISENAALQQKEAFPILEQEEQTIDELSATQLIQEKPSVEVQTEQSSSNQESSPPSVEADEVDSKGEKQMKLSPKAKKVLAIVGGCIGLVLIILFLIMVAFSGTVEKQLDIDKFYNGIFVENIDLSGKTFEEAETLMKDLELSLRDPINITLTYKDKSYHYTEDDFTFAYDTQEVLKEAYQIGREGFLWFRYFKVQSLKHSPQKFNLNHELDEMDQILTQIAAATASELNSKPQNATVGKFNPSAGSDIESMFQVKDGVIGVEVNQNQLIEDCRLILESEDKTGTVEIKATETPFEVDKDELMKRISKLSSFSTVSTNTANGNHNMANALNRINGTIVQPGETFSFNETVGRRTAANGFRMAGVIQNGELVDGLGGGVCQASTTVYGAVIRAGLEIVERGNHRWPSSYVPIGQDAMVSWGSQDMKFKNNTEHPIFIKSYMYGTTLNVIVYGDKPEEWDEIKISSWKTSTLYPGKPNKIEDDTLPKGTETVKIEERYGSTASAQRTYYKDGEKIKTEALPNSRYNAVNETILVGTAEDPENVDDTNPPDKNEKPVEQ